MREYSAALICPLKEEAAAVARKCDNSTPIDDNFFEATYSDEKGTLKLLIARPNRKGPISAAILTTALAARFSTRLICITGICGSLSGPFKKRAYVGDVIFADAVVKFENTKFFNEDIDHSATSILTDELIVAEFREYLSNILTKKTRKSLIPAAYGRGNPNEYGRSSPTIIIGPIASTESVIKSSRYSSKIRETLYRQINSMLPLAVEMEFSGVYEAAKFYGLSSKLFMIRAVNDMADEHKFLQQADNRSSACANAATVALDFISYLTHGGRYQSSVKG